MERKTIGIDLGHCETSAAYPRQTQSDRYEVRRLNLMDKDQVISTQIILTNEQMQKLMGHPYPDYDLLQGLGEIRIGNNLSAYVPDGEKFIYFKVAPKDFDKPYGSGACAKRYGITHGMLMACFAFALVNNLLKYNVGDISEAERENLDLLIGCPSTADWTSQDAQDVYSHLVKSASKVHNVRIIPESRAAMFSSVENEQERISALDGVLVFDFGSSTADCTYMLLGRKMLEFSWTLGASEVERQMSRNAYQDAILENGPFTASAESMLDNEDVLRAAKEIYYSGGNPKGRPVYCSFENTKDNSMIDTRIPINNQYMEKVIGENDIQILCDSRTILTGSWKVLCLGFFRETARRIANATYCIEENGKKKQVPCGIKTIVLTGGASKMGFIYDLCQEVFPDVHIHRETNPSHTVSNGLAWVAVSDENFNTCREAARLEINSTRDCNIDILRTNICNALFSWVVKVGEERTYVWANRPEENVPLRVLQDDLTAYINRPESQDEMEAICQREIEQWKAGLSVTMENAVNNQVKKLYSEQVARSLMIPNDIWQELQSSALSINQIDMSAILKNLDMSSVMLKISKAIVLVVIWCAATALALETFGISILVGLIADLIAEVTMTDADLDKPRDKKTRIKVAQKIRSKLGEEKSTILEAFSKDLEQQTEVYSDIVDTTLTAALEVVTLKRFEV